MGKLQNITDQIFNRLTVLEFSHSDKGRARWKCQCECGNITIVSGKELRNGNTKSCGCLSRENTIARNKSKKGQSRGYKDDLKGQRYGKLLVLEFSHMDKHHKSHWLCKCDCDNEVTVSYSCLKKGHTSSCGCIRKETTAARGRDNLKDITGQQFGRLTVLYRADENRGSSVCWICRCECGTERAFCSADLLDGGTTSCGCYRSELNKTDHGCIKHLPSGMGALGSIYSGYRHNARKRGFDFLITKEQFYDISQRNCYYCGAPPSNLANPKNCNGSFIYNGIDRIDNSEGYIVENCVPCCGMCNKAKNKYGLSEFAEWVERIAANIDRWKPKSL